MNIYDFNNKKKILNLEKSWDILNKMYTKNKVKKLENIIFSDYLKGLFRYYLLTQKDNYNILLITIIIRMKI